MKYFLVILLSLFWVGCAKEDKVDNTGQDQIILSATFSNETRATATAFEGGDELGLFVTKSGMEIQSKDNLVDNHKMIVGDDGVIKGTPTAVYYPSSQSSSQASSSKINLHSYYPYQSGNAIADALGVLVGIRTDQTDFLEVKRSDLCLGSVHDISPSREAQPITFRHSFSQVKINVTTYAGCEKIKQLRLINVKDSATLNIQSGVISLKQHTDEVLCYQDKDNSNNPINSFTAIIPAQTFSGACIAIDLVDPTDPSDPSDPKDLKKKGETYIYNAVSSIVLVAAATNTLNLAINDKGVITLTGAPTVTAWNSNSQGGVISEEVRNKITLRWLAPHADFAMADKIVLTVVDLYNVTREIEAVLTIDPTSSAQYAVYTFPLAIVGSGYPMMITQTKIYKGATLLRQSPQAAILGATLYRAGDHVVGINLSIDISPSDDWKDVANTLQTRTITVNTVGTDNWTAVATGAGLSVTPSGTSGKTATITWAAQITTGDSPARSGTVTFSTVPSGVTYTIKTNQLMGPYYLAINPAGNWADVANTLQTRSVTVNTGNISGWTVAASGEGLSVSPTSGTNGGNTTITWQANSVVGALARNSSVTFSPNPASTAAPITIATSQLAGPVPTLTLTLVDAIDNPIPKEGKTYRVNLVSNTAWTARTDYGSYVTLSQASGTGTVNNLSITVATTSLSATRPVNAIFTTSAVPSGATASQTWAGTQAAAGPEFVTINGLRWATGNLIANGLNSCKAGAPTDYGLYFHFGSLVGWSGGANGDGTGTGQPAMAQKVKPSGYSGSTGWPAGHTTSGNVPSTDNAATGIGDPCRYYLGGTWRLPTNTEFQTSLCFGAGNGSSPSTAQAAWVSSPAGMNFNNNSTKVFFPASGYRYNSNGSLGAVGSGGHYWSSVQYNSPYGYYQYFGSGNVTPQDSYYRPYGFSVRCVSN